MLRGSIFGLLLGLFFCGLAQPASAVRQLAARDNWARYSPGESDLSIELPGKPEPYDTPIPDDAKMVVTELKGFMSTGSHMVVVINRSVTITAVPPKAVAIEMMATMAKDPGVSELTYTTEPGNALQANVKAAWKTHGVVVESQGLVIANGLQGWTVMAIYQQSAVAGRTDARRSLESIKLNSRSLPAIAPAQPAGGTAAWKRYSPGEVGLSLELPGEPGPFNYPIPQDVAQQIQDFKSYLYRGTNWVVLTNSLTVSGPWNLHSFATGVVKGITDASGVTDVQYSLEPATSEKIPLSGSYKMNNNPKTFAGFAIASGNRIYMVIAVWSASDESARAAAKRVLDSVRVTSS